MTDLDQRRIALADELAVLMRRAGMSGRQLAAAVGWQASKVFRILSGKQRVTDDDLATWLAATDALDTEAERLRDELRAIRAEEARWSRRAAGGHRATQEDMAACEQRTACIRVVDLALIPGLVQTADYARAVFTALADLRDAPETPTRPCKRACNGSTRSTTPCAPSNYSSPSSPWAPRSATLRSWPPSLIGYVPSTDSPTSACESPRSV